MTRHPIGSLSLAALLLLSLHGCTHDLLQVTDPDIIPDVNTPSGALALKNGVILRLEQVTAGLGGNGPDNLFIYGGLLADEWRSGDTFVQRNDMDQRLFDPTNTFLAGPLRALNRVRVESHTELDKSRAVRSGGRGRGGRRDDPISLQRHVLDQRGAERDLESEH